MNDDPVFFSASAHHALAYITDPDPAAVAETAVALANTDGGTLLIQGDMDGAALPVLLAYAAEQCNPAIVFGAPRPVTTGDGPAVAVHVLRGTCVHALADGQVLVRIYQANQPLNGDQIRRLVSARTNGDFDAEVVPGAVLDDLSPDLIDNYLTCAPTFRHGAEDGYSVENKLRDVDAVTPEGGITVAGMLLFGIDPQRWLPHSAVRFICMIGKYPGGSGKAGRAFEQVVGGASVRLIDDLWALIQEQMPQQRVTGTPGKQCYPAAAVREALLNAVIHRNYRLRHRSVKVMLYADQLLVTSPGGLPGFMTMDTLTGGCFSRNPRLSRVLREWDTASPSGMGIRGMMAQTAQHGCP
ncbi:MAG: hypothetical protein JXQ72_01570, partial [Anaerolineae bacterium]|nr:hypothetical protein [Anaerolineae bacterium]